MRKLHIELIQSHEKLIAHIANQFAQTMDYDAEELISFGRAVVIKNMRKWQPERAKFSTFIWWLLRSAFIEYIKKQRKLVLTDVLDECIPTADTSLPARLADLLSGVGSDAYEMVDTILKSKWHEDMSRLHTRLHNEMIVKRKWTEAKYDCAFDEIEALVAAW
jgi:RNA polymerase sigma factor (sigma-70 family)